MAPKVDPGRLARARRFRKANPDGFAKFGTVEQLAWSVVAGSDGVAVLAALRQYASLADGAASPAVESIAALSGCSPRTVDRVVRSAEEVGLLTRVQRGLRQTNLYFLRPVDAARVCTELGLQPTQPRQVGGSGAADTRHVGESGNSLTRQAGESGRTDTRQVGESEPANTRHADESEVPDSPTAPIYTRQADGRTDQLNRPVRKEEGARAPNADDVARARAIVERRLTRQADESGAASAPIDEELERFGLEVFQAADAPDVPAMLANAEQMIGRRRQGSAAVAANPKAIAERARGMVGRFPTPNVARRGRR
jgi:hypothetical protein